MTHVLVVGAGVVGCSIGLELARRGARATVVDRLGDAGHGSTSASCGIVRRYYSTPTMTAMAEEGARIWASWGEYLGLGADAELARFERPGMLFIPPEVDANIESILAHMRALGVRAELLSAEDVARRFPFLDVRSQRPIRDPGDEDFFEDGGRDIAGAIFEPDAGYVVSPLLATANLREAGAKEGVRFLLGRDVLSIAAGEGPARFRVRFADGGHEDADVVINAAGPHSVVVNRLAGVDLGIEVRALRREVCAVENPLDGRRDVPIVADIDSGVYARPECGGRDLAIGSLDPETDEMEWVDPDAWDDTCSVDGFERQTLRFMKRMPELRLGGRRGVAGLYDVTLLDWNPVLDRTDLDGYYVAVGTSGSSFKTAPVIGEVMARLVEACEAGRDHDRDPLRVKLARTGFEVDVSFFSRLRSAQRSSGTVLG